MGTCRRCAYWSAPQPLDREDVSFYVTTNLISFVFFWLLVRQDRPFEDITLALGPRDGHFSVLHFIDEMINQLVKKTIN